MNIKVKSIIFNKKKYKEMYYLFFNESIEHDWNMLNFER